jgi:hypothetical protein
MIMAAFGLPMILMTQARVGRSGSAPSRGRILALTFGAIGLIGLFVAGLVLSVMAELSAGADSQRHTVFEEISAMSRAVL